MNPADLAVKSDISVVHHKKSRVLADGVSNSVGGVYGQETKPDVSLNGSACGSGDEGMFPENRCSDGGRDGEEDRIDRSGGGDNGSVWEVGAEAEAEAGWCGGGRDDGVTCQVLPEETNEGCGIRCAGGAQGLRWDGHSARVGQNSVGLDVSVSDDENDGHHCLDLESIGDGKQGLEEVAEGRKQTRTERGARSSDSSEHGSVLAGSAAACGAFGVVDPEVLKQLPLDIQREILAQQVYFLLCWEFYGDGSGVGVGVGGGAYS